VTSSAGSGSSVRGGTSGSSARASDSVEKVKGSSGGCSFAGEKGDGLGLFGVLGFVCALTLARRGSRMRRRHEMPSE
jgi:hypothetical protein